MHHMCRISLVLLVAVGLLTAGGMAGASPIINSVTFSSSQFGDGSCLSSLILKPDDVLSASFAPGTPAGSVTINVTQAATQARLVTTHIHALAVENVPNAGTVTINGHVFSVTTCDTISALIQMINNASVGVTAAFDSITHKVVLTGNSGYGSDYGFTYAETADILNDGPAHNGTCSGGDARGTVTYCDGSTENYGSGRGVQLVGDIRGGVIDLSATGGMTIANLGHCIDIVQHGSVECGSYLTSNIADRTDIASASFPPGTPVGCVGVDVTSAARKASLTTTHVYACGTTANIANNGVITINGHEFSFATSQTVADVIQTINNAGVGVTATWDAGNYKVVLRDDSGYGSDHSFTYAETADILNGGPGCNARFSGCNAAATVTYSNGFVEPYSYGRGLQLKGNQLGGVINLTEAGRGCGNHAAALWIAPANLIGCGDAVTVTMDVSALYPITTITSPITGPLVHTSGNIWSGTFCAASTVDNNELTFTIVDSAGVSTFATAYATVPCFGTNLRSAYHSIMDNAATLYLYTVSGSVASVESDCFYLNDGSGMQIKVVGAGSQYEIGNHLIVRGQLDMGASPHVIVAHSVSKME